MHYLCFQSFGTNEISAKEEKRFGIYENVSCNICVVLSGHTVKLAAGNCQKQLEFLLVCVLFTLRAWLKPLARDVRCRDGTKKELLLLLSSRENGSHQILSNNPASRLFIWRPQNIIKM